MEKNVPSFFVNERKKKENWKEMFIKVESVITLKCIDEGELNDMKKKEVFIQEKRWKTLERK